jgi:hypothetical protein
MTRDPGPTPTPRIEVTLTGGRRDVEAITLEFCRLAKEHGVAISAPRVQLLEELQQDSAGPEIWQDGSA